MTEFVFNFLNSIGFHHPLHPIVVHWPMGMVIGLFLFGLTSYFFHKTELARTAYHCSILGFIGVFPAVLFGYMDWQHSYGGQWLLLIKIKIVLAVVLAVLLAISIAVGKNETEISTKRLVLYILCMMTAGGLGFCGGQLIYG